MASKKKSFLQTISQNKAEAAKPKTEERKYFLQYMPEIQAIKQQNIENKKPVYQRFLDTYGKADGAVENPATMSKTLETQIDQATRLIRAKQEEASLDSQEAVAKSEGRSFDREEAKKTANMSIEEYEKHLLEQKQKSQEQVENEKRQKLRQDAYWEEMSNFEVERREKARKEELEALYSLNPNHPFLTEGDKLELEILRIKYPVTSEEIGSTRTGEIYDGDRVPLFVTDTVLENTELLENIKLDPATDAILKDARVYYESQMNVDNKFDEAERIFGRVGLDSFPEERLKLENAYSEYSQGRITRAQYEAIVDNVYNFAKSALPSIETAEMVAERRQTISNIKQEIEALEAIPNKTWNEEKRIADLYSLLAVYDNRLYRNPGEGGSGTFTKNPDEAKLTGNWIEANAASGIANFVSGVVSTADFLIPTELFIDEENDPFSIADESAKDLAQKVSEAAYQSARELGGGGWHTGGELIASVVEMLPSIALSFGTGGASVASGSKMLNAGAMLNNGGKLTNAGRRIVNGIKTVGKNPQFWMSVARTLGPSYDEAIANGATNEEATYYALVSTALNSLIELGGIEALPQKVRGGGKPLFEYVKSVFNEGKEEVLQGIVSKAFAAMIYDEETKIYSETDENAIINPNRIKKEFTLGTAAAAILGSPTAIVNSVNNQIAYADTGKSIKARGTESALISESLKAPETSDLYKAASKLANKKNISNAELGKLFYAYNDYTTKAKGIDTYDYEEVGIPVGEIDNRFDYKGGAYAEINSLIQNNEATSYIADRIMEIDNTVSREEAVDAVERAKARAFDQSVAKSSMLDFEKSKAIEMYQLKEQALERMYNLGKQGLGFDYSMGAGLLSEVDAHQAYTRGTNKANVQIEAPEVTTPEVTSPAQVDTKSVEAVTEQVQSEAPQKSETLEKALNTAPEAPVETEEAGTVDTETDNEAVTEVINSLGRTGSAVYSSLMRTETNAETRAKMRSAIAHVYEAGLNGTKYKRSKADGLHIKEINAVYEAGVKDAQEKQGAKRKADAKLVKDDTYKSTKTSKRVEKTLEGIAKITGRDIRFSDTLESNAKIDLKNGEIIISTKAQNGSAWAMIHEVYHAMEIDAPKEANALKNTVMGIAQKNWSRFKKLANVYENTYYSEITDEDGNLKVDAAEIISGEMVADILGYIISDRQILSTLTGQQKGTIQKFLDKVASYFGGDRLKEYLSGYRPESRAEIRALFNDVQKEAKSLAEQFKVGIRAIGNIDKNGVYVSHESETADGERFSRRITPEQDADYMKAVEGGDMETAQRMVDETAEKAFPNSKVRDNNGKLVHVYHGTSKGGYTVFDTYAYYSKFGLFGNGAYFTEDRSIAEQYTNKGRGDKPQVYNAYLNITNPIDMDAKADISLWNKALERADLDYISLSEGMTNEGAFREVTETLADEGYVSYEAEEVVRNIFENMGYDGITHIGGGRANKSDGTRHRVWIAFESEQIKSADPVTYDDNGNVIPLSERFDLNNPDIRWSKSVIEDPEQRGKLWKELIDEYGAIKKGEKPARDIQVPKKLSKDDVVSQHARTMLEAGITPDYMVSEFEKSILDGTMTHRVITDKKSEADAIDRIKRDGFEDALKYFYTNANDNRLTKQDIVLGMVLFNQCATNGDVKNAMKIDAEMALAFTNAGQILQSGNMIKKMSPDGQLYYLEKSIEKMNKEFRQQVGKGYEDIVIDEALLTQFFEAKSEDERNAAYNNILKNIAPQIPSRLRDKWTSWRYLSMLGTIATHDRNFMGNLITGVAAYLKNKVAGVGEKAIIRDKSKRKRAVFATPQAYMFAAKDAKKMKREIRGSGAKFGFANEIDNMRTIFKLGEKEQRLLDNAKANKNKPFNWFIILHSSAKQGIFKVVEAARKFNFNALEVEDWVFLRLSYQGALASFITARGLDVNNISTKDLTEAREYAIQQALVNTYREVNALAKFIQQTKTKAARSPNILVRGGGIALESTSAFVSTPINIAKESMNYSPLGLLNTISQIIMKQKGVEGYDTNRIIDTFSKNFTGSALMVIGVFLAKWGILSGNDDEDEKVKQFNKTVGKQSYSLNFGDTSYTISWASPSSIPLLAGAELYDAIKDDELTTDSFLRTIGSLTNPLFEATYLQGISDALDEFQYADSKGEGVMNLLASALADYFLQGVPSLANQVAKFTDGTRRNIYYHDKTSGVPREIQLASKKFASKVPGLSDELYPSLDAWGQSYTYGSTGKKLAESTISPGFISKTEYSEIEEEIERLYEATDNTDVLPPVHYKKLNKQNLSEEEFYTLNKYRGEQCAIYVKEIISSDNYKKLSDVEKVEAIAECYKRAKTDTELKHLGTDYWGREKSSPYSDKDYKQVNDELLRLFANTSTDDMYPTKQQDYYTEDGERYDMTDEEFDEARMIRGQKSMELVYKLINDKMFVKGKKYSKMTDEEKVEALKKCYKEAGAYTKDQMIEKVKR